MPYRTFAAIVTLFSLMTFGCSSVTFERTEKPDIYGSVGFRYYPPKPYMLVQRAEDNTLTAKVISLPDLNNPRYLKHKPGLGAVEFNFTTENGIITSFGQKSDSKVPETLTAATGGFASLATGYKTIWDALHPPETAAATKTQNFMGEMEITGTASTVKIGLVIKSGKALKNDVIDALATANGNGGNAGGKFSLILKDITEAQAKLATYENLPFQNDLTALVEQAQKDLAPVVESLARAHAKLTQSIDKAQGTAPDIAAAQYAAIRLSEIIGDLNGFLPQRPGIELYEINVDANGFVSFTKVPFPPRSAPTTP